ncbi:MAG: diphthine--ammonia ligase [Thermodesulfovibrionia bacterium]
MYLASWSGGKDSCLACYKAIKDGVRVSHLLHFDREGNLHGVSADLIKAQMRLSGLGVIQKRVSGDFESVFRETVKEINHIKGIVFGDIYLEEHRAWIERVCNDLHVDALFPLWKMDTGQILMDFIARGFEAVIVSVRKELIGREWIGRRLDTGFIRHLKTRGLDVCGENGEYHTFVVGGPLFKGRIEIHSNGCLERDGHWFLDIKDMRVI